MTQSQKKNFVVPLACIGLMFFAVGFALGLNGLLIPLLKSSLHVSGFVSYLIIFVTFAAFLIFGYPAGWIIKKIGYKKTMALAFFIFTLAFLLFVWPANIAKANMVEIVEDGASKMVVAEGFRIKCLILFLIASFISGLSNTVLSLGLSLGSNCIAEIGLDECERSDSCEIEFPTRLNGNLEETGLSVDVHLEVLS